MQSVSQLTNYTYIDRGHMLWDNALKFNSDHAYIIPQKPIENGQYMAFWQPFWKFVKLWMETTYFISETVNDRAKRSLFLNPVGFLTTNLQLLNFGSHDPSRSHDLGNVNRPLYRKPLEIKRNGHIFEPPGFTTYEITTFENIDFRSHDPSRSHDLRNVNWPLSQKR